MGTSFKIERKIEKKNASPFYSIFEECADIFINTQNLLYFAAIGYALYIEM